MVELRDNAHRGSTAGNGGALSFAVLPSQAVEIGSHITRQIAFLTPICAEHTSALAGEDRLLPTILFKRVFICYEGHFLIFDPR